MLKYSSVPPETAAALWFSATRIKAVHIPKWENISYSEIKVTEDKMRHKIFFLKMDHSAVRNKVCRFFFFFLLPNASVHLTFKTAPAFSFYVLRCFPLLCSEGFQDFSPVTVERLQSLKSHPQRAKSPGQSYTSLSGRNEPACHAATKGSSPILFTADKSKPRWDQAVKGKGHSFKTAI